MKIFNKTGAFVMAALSAMSVSCTIEEATVYAGCELGAAVKQLEVSAEAGYVDVDVYSNRRYNIDVLEDASWLEFPSLVDGAGGFRVEGIDDAGNKACCIPLSDRASSSSKVCGFDSARSRTRCTVLLAQPALAAMLR